MAKKKKAPDFPKLFKGKQFPSRSLLSKGHPYSLDDKDIHISGKGLEAIPYFTDSFSVAHQQEMVGDMWNSEPGWLGVVGGTSSRIRQFASHIMHRYESPDYGFSSLPIHWEWVTVGRKEIDFPPERVLTILDGILPYEVEKAEGVSDCRVDSIVSSKLYSFCGRYRGRGSILVLLPVDSGFELARLLKNLRISPDLVVNLKAN